MANNILEKLRLFGLTDYEARAYSALASIGIGNVTELSQICDVPRSNLYGVLESLNEKGFVEIQKGRPLLFKAVEPKKALAQTEQKIIEELKQAKKGILKEFDKINNTKKKNVEPALIWGIRGYSSVMQQLKEMIKRCRKELLINTPDIQLLEELMPELEEAKKRKIQIRIATEKNSNIKKFRKIGVIRVRNKIHGIDVVSDDSEILIAPVIPVVAAWVNNAEMALHVKDFLELVWRDSEIPG